jgi:hypothetical protein
MSSDGEEGGGGWKVMLEAGGKGTKDVLRRPAAGARGADTDKDDAFPTSFFGFLKYCREISKSSASILKDISDDGFHSLLSV